MFNWLFRPTRRSPVAAKRRQLQVEALEDRCVPSISSTFNISGSDIEKTGPATASSASGYSVVVWSDSNEIFANLYGRNHSKVGDTIQVSNGGFGGNFEPDVAMSKTGDFVVVWSNGFSGSSEVDYALINHSGQRGNSGTVTGIGGEPQVAMDRSGGFAVSYTFTTQPNTANQDILVARFDSEGTQGRGISVATVSNRTIDGKRYVQDEFNSCIAIADGGRISVSYIQRSVPLGDQPEPVMQIKLNQYSGDGTLRGKYTIGKGSGHNVPNHDLAINRAGECIVVYDRGRTFGNENIYMRILTHSEQLHEQLQKEVAIVASSSYESNPSIALNRSTGNFVVAYHKEVSGVDRVVVAAFSSTGKEMTHYNMSSNSFEGDISIDGSDRFFVTYWAESQGMVKGRFGRM